MKHGDRFSAVIDYKFVEGKISIENNKVYLCQNEADGAMCYNKLGYEYSWFIAYYPDFNETTLKKEQVSNFKLFKARKTIIEELKL